ncbi:uncharacterized protein LOC133716365 [Rosa rugosa]|uniref:uncharacterized protein LOC133716365 n=1 Tax=Rosa rugosa TaxID=74645 RepID=UPI002B403645|nr:uncharacterized protein LOC133716365 [Rosa rugosa]
MIVIINLRPEWPLHTPPLPLTDRQELVGVPHDSCTWKASLLESTFSPEDCEIITSIPLSFRLPPDRIIWHYDPKGIFSVKSAYVVARDRILQINNGASSSSLSQSSSQLWGSIWKAHVPAKVKEWFLSYMEHFTKEHVDLFMVLFSTIWMTRNDTLWHGLESSPADVSIKGIVRLQAFHAANPYHKTNRRRQLVRPCWTPPPQAWLKVNVDGAFNASMKMGGIGLVIRDSSGHFVAGHAAPLTQI